LFAKVHPRIEKGCLKKKKKTALEKLFLFLAFIALFKKGKIFIKHQKLSEMEKKHWWSHVILGIILLALGIVILLFPETSYITMSVLFGIIIALSGIMYICMGFQKNLKGRGWLLVGGVVELALGIYLTFTPALSALTLPLVLGFWLLFKGFSLLGLTFSKRSGEDAGWGLAVFSGAMLILCGMIILLQPLLYGAEAVILWTGISLIIGGCTYLNYGFKLK
jgi:uncharacterized membrane protein HdeD (DUF308 family)